ncbi:PREDICTED: uncharacterized protein LOC109114247 [Nelumbo nucifera]|uniref:Uncharacterized protein LOC109114247 n=1 Tax=Nelumbo nucifera TaxID=4432 RepID=A0A1U8Q257_NELNU|nr:PREDICTED: uncharacterized protein LOC109114247 [Nelumbo nucifera]
MDTSLFIYNYNGIIMYVLVYVNDILVMGNDTSAITTLIEELSHHFALKDLGSIHYFLGVEAHDSDAGLHLCQRKYIADLLRRAHMNGSKPISTPFCMSTSASKHYLPDATEYRSIVRALQYLLITRPNITFVVNRLCQHIYLPTEADWSAVKKVLRYTKHTIDYGLIIKPSSTYLLQAYSDSDWARFPEDRKSTTGDFLGDNLISWCSKK